LLTLAVYSAGSVVAALSSIVARHFDRWKSLAVATRVARAVVIAGDKPSSDAKIGCVLPPDKAVIRRENTGDRSTVRSINEAAFGRPDEADLVERLRTEGAVLLSLVAEFEQRIVGHILFSRMSIETGGDPVSAVALAPMAVLPGHQRRGIGERLIRHGLNLLRGRGEQIVIVLGHPDYYPRFGFSSQRARSLASPFPPEALMAMELRPGALDGIRGKVRYPGAFGL
jgi:putative acetyltransferase